VGGVQNGAEHTHVPLKLESRLKDRRGNFKNPSLSDAGQQVQEVTRREALPSPRIFQNVKSKKSPMMLDGREMYLLSIQRFRLSSAAVTADLTSRTTCSSFWQMEFASKILA
jgi:hypothetical protein